jgi:hypothetical protein
LLRLPWHTGTWLPHRGTYPEVLVRSAGKSAAAWARVVLDDHCDRQIVGCPGTSRHGGRRRSRLGCADVGTWHRVSRAGTHGEGAAALILTDLAPGIYDKGETAGTVVSTDGAIRQTAPTAICSRRKSNYGWPSPRMHTRSRARHIGGYRVP